MIYLYLFITFFEIGIFGFGGGYGMLSLHGRVHQHRSHIANDTRTSGNKLRYLLWICCCA